jgi:hypothetical protein
MTQVPVSKPWLVVGTSALLRLWIKVNEIRGLRRTGSFMTFAVSLFFFFFSLYRLLWALEQGKSRYTGCV